MTGTRTCSVSFASLVDRELLRTASLIRFTIPIVAVTVRSCAAEATVASSSPRTDRLKSNGDTKQFGQLPPITETTLHTSGMSGIVSVKKEWLSHVTSYVCTKGEVCLDTGFR